MLARAAHSRGPRREALATGFKTADMPRAYTGRFMQHPASQLADECGGIVLAIAPHSRTARRGALATGFKTADMLEAYHGFFVHASLQASLRARVQKSHIPLECSRLPLRRDRDSNPRYDFVVYTLSRRAS